MSAVLTDLQVQEVVSLPEAHVVAWIRNQCLGKFTHHNEFIDVEQQRAWWESKPDVRMWLYRNGDDWVGFGLLRPDETGRRWATLGVVPKHRRQGYGTAIYRHLMEQHEQVWIGVSESNPTSYKAARNAGFVVVDVHGKVLTMVAGKGSE